jgi:uncharacterized protein
MRFLFAHCSFPTSRITLYSKAQVLFFEAKSDHVQFEVAMGRMQYLLLLLLLVVIPVRAQDKCPFGFGGEKAADGLDKALHDQKSCKSAVELMSKCRWGSSADSEFAPIAIEKCEGDFLKKLSPAGMDNYTTQMQLCAYEYARQEGTISISEAAMCQVDVAAKFASDIVANDHVPAKASFDCTKAQTVLEKSICSDVRLGHADLVLAVVYENAKKWAGPDVRAKLAQSERNWLGAMPPRCKIGDVPLSEEQVNCLRDQIETRFSIMDGCGDAEDSGACLLDIDSPENVNDIGPATAMPRASFDCEAPKTGLEIVICADSDLGQADIKLTQVYHDTDAKMGSAQHHALVESENGWLHFVNSTCPLGVVGGIPPVLTRACVRSAFETRIDQLQACSEKPAGEQVLCLNAYRLDAK